MDRCGFCRGRLLALLARRNLQPAGGKSWLTARGQRALKALAQTWTLRLGRSSRNRNLNSCAALYAGADTPIHIADGPEDLMLLVVGGPGGHSALITTFGHTRAVTRPIPSP